jgi:hypothetical protein
VKSFSAAGRGFGTPFVVSKIRIPEFQPADELHRKLAGLSRALHEGGNPEHEREIDRSVLLL